MRATLLFIALLSAASANPCRIDLAQDECSVIVKCGDKPGITTIIQRVCTMPTKAAWAAETGLDTTVAVDTTRPDTTGIKK